MSSPLPPFWDSLGPCLVCLAPMIDMGDLAFRIMVRRYGVSLTWTGMHNANQWNSSRRFRSTLETSNIDTPLICQVSGSSSSDIVKAAVSIAEQSKCAAIDINLGCCQSVARRGSYGYFMVDSESKRTDVLSIVRDMSRALSVPLFVKIRILEANDGTADVEGTAQFAVSLEAAGARLISVHARPPKQDKCGDVDITCIKRIVDLVSVPVVANGGIICKQQAADIVAKTGAAGVMVGQALLRDPSLFSDVQLTPFDACREYLDIFAETGGAFAIARRHMFYFLDDVLGTNVDLRGTLGRSANADEVRSFVDTLEQ